MPDINLSSFQKYAQSFINLVKSTGETKVDAQTFQEKVTSDISIFEMLDQNGDGKISEDEVNTVLEADSDSDGIVTEREFMCMEQMKFKARRTVDKWFSLDINRDGHRSNVETRLGDYRMFEKLCETYTGLDASMTNEQLAKLYGIEEIVDDTKNATLESWLNDWLEDLTQEAKVKYGVELNNSQITVIKREYKKQLNTWLFKTGDNATENAPLYNSLNTTAYTRLITTDETESCCGGNIIPPPSSANKRACLPVFSNLEPTKEQMADIEKQIQNIDKQLETGEITLEKYNEEREKLFNFSNTSKEVKNRLAWAMFPVSQELKEINEEINREIKAKINSGEISEQEAKEYKEPIWARLSDETYQNYHQQYMQMRNMKASDFRELLKPENEQKRIEFEKNSSMTVKQIVDYIDIVERQIGAGKFDDDNWSVNAKQYKQIVFDINDTTGDEDRLRGKTRADIPENRQNLLRFLEEKGWLYEQFK